MGGLLIDTFAYNFIKNYEHRDKSKVYYDWIARDFLKYLSERDDTKLYWLALGSNQRIWYKGKFDYKAKVAYNKSLEAISAQKDEHWYTACNKWRKIFGYQFPNYGDIS